MILIQIINTNQRCNIKAHQFFSNPSKLVYMCPVLYMCQKGLIIIQRFLSVDIPGCSHNSRPLPTLAHNCDCLTWSHSVTNILSQSQHAIQEFSLLTDVYSEISVNNFRALKICCEGNILILSITIVVVIENEMFFEYRLIKLIWCY